MARFALANLLYAKTKTSYGLNDVAEFFEYLDGRVPDQLILQWGWDKRVDATGAVFPNRYLSVGWFGEVHVPWNDYVGGIVRYDRLDPSRSSSDDLAQAFTIAANLSDQRGGQVILEYRYRDEETGANTRLKTNEVRLRLLYVF